MSVDLYTEYHSHSLFISLEIANKWNGLRYQFKCKIHLKEEKQKTKLKYENLLWGKPSNVCLMMYGFDIFKNSCEMYAWLLLNVIMEYWINLFHHWNENEKTK